VIKNNYLKILFYLCFVLISITSYNRTASTNLDFKVFHQAALRVVNNQYDFYNYQRDGIFTYKYSPIFPLMTAPLGLMSELNARKTWAIINVIALPLAWFSLSSIFIILSGVSEISYAAHLITLLLLAQPITNNATQGNINSILLAIMSLALYFSFKEKKYYSSILAAIGFSIKLTPGVLFIYFLFYKKWKELLLTTVLSAMLLMVLPFIYFGFHQTIELYLGWKTVLSNTTHFPFYKYTNQSPLVVMTHWQGIDTVNLISKLFYYLINLIMGLSLFYFYKRKNKLVFLSLIFMLLLTASPVVWMEYYLVLLFPYLVIHQWLVTHCLSVSSKILWYIKLLYVHLLVKLLIGNHYSDLIAQNGRSFIGLVLILLIYFIEDFRINNSQKI